MGVDEFLAGLPLFRHLNPDALQRLADQIRVIHFSDGHKIRDVTRGTAPIDGLYLIKSGVAKVSKPSESWEAEAVLAILGKGSCFGEIGLLDGLPPSANVTALEPMECFFLARGDFLSALEENPEIALGMLPGLSAMVRGADRWIAQLL